MHSVRMARPPRRRPLERPGPDAAARFARFALLGVIGPISGRLSGTHHRGAEIDFSGKADRDRAAVTILLACPAAKLAALGEPFQEPGRRAPAGERMAGAQAGLAEFRSIDAEEPDFDPGDAKTVAVDHLRGTDDVRDRALREQARRGKAQHRRAAEERDAGAAMRDPAVHPMGLEACSWSVLARDPPSVNERSLAERAPPGRRTVPQRSLRAHRTLSIRNLNAFHSPCLPDLWELSRCGQTTEPE